MGLTSKFSKRLLKYLPIILTVLICITFYSNPIAQTRKEAERQKKVSNKEPDNASKKRVFYIFRNGEFVEDTLDTPVEPKGGFSNLYRHADIRYPAIARARGIQGTVLITVIVNEFGRVEEYSLKKGIGGGCDEESLRVFSFANEIGFDPPLNHGKPVKVKFDVPIIFTLP